MLDIAHELITLGLTQHAEKFICVVDLQINDCLELQQKWTRAWSPWKHTCMNKKKPGKSLLNVFQKLLPILMKKKKEVKSHQFKKPTKLVVLYDTIRYTRHHACKKTWLYYRILTKIQSWGNNGIPSTHVS